jgi:hypothetical protein
VSAARRADLEGAGLLAVVFIVSLLIYTVSLWLGAKITKTDAKFLELLIVAGIASVFGLIPAPLGPLLSIIVLFVLLYRWIGIDPIPDAVLLVVVAKLVEFGVVWTIVHSLAG